MKVSYKELRSQIRTGDVLAFEKLPLLRVRGCADLGGWLSNRLIYRNERRGNVDNDGYERIVHVAVAVHNHTHNEVMGYEYTAGMDGLKPFRISTRIRDYNKRGGRVHLFRLNATARQRLDESKAEQWAEKHRQNGYAYLPLVYATLGQLPFRPWINYRDRKKLYCSPGVMVCLMELGAIPDRRKVLRAGEPAWVWEDESPMELAPSEMLRRLDLFGRRTQIEITMEG